VGAVGEIEHVVDVVADEEDAEALGLESPDEVGNLRGFLRADRRKRCSCPLDLVDIELFASAEKCRAGTHTAEDPLRGRTALAKPFRPTVIKP
jgi:hypothetical protein